jgi:hypothetical protein
MIAQTETGMTKAKNPAANKVGEPDKDKELEQRFRELGAIALIEEIELLSKSLASVSQRLADAERANELILGLLDFPLPGIMSLQRPLQKSSIITATMFCSPADGFYGVQHLDDSTPYRWTGPTPGFRFLVYVDRRQDCPAEIILIDNGRMSEGVGIDCYVDQNWVPSKPRPSDGRFIRLGFTVPKLDISRGTEITFVAPSVFVPSEVVPGSTDTRSLGVQFVELRVGAAEAGAMVESGASDGKQLAD